MRVVFRHPLVMLSVALVVQIALAVLGSLDIEHHPMGDITYAYEPWVSYMLTHGGLLGVNLNWVYPFPALAPLFFAHFVSPQNYLLGWIVMAIGLNQLALWWLIRKNKESTFLGWYWILATIALGPVAISRLDGIALAFSMIALPYLFSGNFAKSSVFLSVATWVKVWPIGFLGSLLFESTNARRVIKSAGAVSLIFLGFGLLLGGTNSLFAFVFQQQSRGLQIESVVGMPWVWASIGAGQNLIYFDGEILSFQVRGTGVDLASQISSWVMVVALIASFLLVARVSRFTISQGEIIALSSLLFTLDLIVFNKVGSPQYMSWLVMPVLVGLFYKVRKWWPAAVGVLVMTDLTQLIYPFSYDGLIAAQLGPVILLTFRNALEVALLLWVLARLLLIVREQKGQKISNRLVFD